MLSCSTCKWFARDNRFCRKNPPIAVPSVDEFGFNRVTSRFPVIQRPESDYCGAYEPFGIKMQESGSASDQFLTEG